MTLAPIFTRDLRSERRNGLRRDRLVVGAISGVVLLALGAVDRWGAGVSLPRILKTLPLTAIAPYVLLIAGLSLGAKPLAVERREGTLPLLVITRLTGHDILLGKLLQAIVVELHTVLSAAPAMVLPALMAGFGRGEIGLLVLGCANALFVGMALGLFAAVFFASDNAVGWIVLLILPFLVLGTPTGTLLPNGTVRQCLSSLQLLNPGEALAHVQTVAAGLRPGAYWKPLVASHLFGWILLALGGHYLAQACRSHASRSLGPTAKRRHFWPLPDRSPEFRTRLLDCNPFLWLTSRDRWTTIKIWIYLLLSLAVWGWFAWFSWAVRGLNLTIIFAIALAAGWMLQFLVCMPAEAGRRLAEDRQSGALEMLLCTPFPVRSIVRGQWLALARRFLPPLLIVTLLTLALGVTGYVTYGFGGMLDAENRGLWLFAWIAGIGLMPLTLTALCWVVMRRTLVAHAAGDASTVALFQVLGLPCILFPTASMLLHSLFGWDLPLTWSASLFLTGVAAVQIWFGWRARAVLYRDLRQAAANRDNVSESGVLPWRGRGELRSHP